MMLQSRYINVSQKVEVIILQSWILLVFEESGRVIFQIFANKSRIWDFDAILFLNMKGNEYHNLHGKFQVHSINMLIRCKNKYVVAITRSSH